ncbi:MAG: threonylcarbamoyl-AMP synthase [Nanoarchaeota archaeon]|nr:threonylcarbamoyl-AMP synthase [Nanoarchaeota archaeon]
MKNFADIKAIKTKVIIYPTDTVYGIGCNAENFMLIERVFAAKGRDMKKPLSVIAPDKDWILAHCVVSREIVDKYLPGKYTILLKKKDSKFLALATSGSDTIGVRIPAHRISKLVERARIPFITTSANRSGEKAPKTLSEIPKDLKDAVDLIIDGGEILGIPSTLVDCRSGKDILIERGN